MFSSINLGCHFAIIASGLFVFFPVYRGFEILPVRVSLNIQNYIVLRTSHTGGGSVLGLVGMLTIHAHDVTY